MNIVGLITEYNPFHNGHLYHIQQAVSRTNADFCIVVMSGNFVQRGAPAIIDKYKRTEMALHAGADLVLELPMPFACASAEIFAHAAVSLFHSLGVVTHLCFGSECADERLLSSLAAIFCKEPEPYRTALQNRLKKGDSFPNARMNAMISYLNDFPILETSAQSEESYLEKSQLQNVLSSPNNILGIEYLKALQRLSSSIRPVILPRISSDYHSTKIQNNISSATAVRRLLETAPDFSQYSASYELLSKAVPNPVLERLQKNYAITMPICSNDFSSILNYCFLTESNYQHYAEWNEELSNRAKRMLPFCSSFDDYASQLKSKNITYTRICRCLIHLMTKITKEDMLSYQQRNYCLYARILGFRKTSASLLSMIKQQSCIPMISKTATAKTILDSTGSHLFEQELFASHLYNQIVFQKFGTVLPDEYRANIIRL